MGVVYWPTGEKCHATQEFARISGTRNDTCSFNRKIQLIILLDHSCIFEGFLPVLPLINVIQMFSLSKGVPPKTI